MRAAQVSTLAVLAGGLALTALFIAAPSPGQRGPFVPKRDDEVLERVMPTPRAPSTPLDEAAALALAERLLSDARRTNDPRLVGRAQATLAPWAGSQTPALRLLRARLAQRQGELGQALAELGDVPDTDAGWQLRSELLFSLARYDESLAACARPRSPAGGCACSTATGSRLPNVASSLSGASSPGRSRGSRSSRATRRSSRAARIPSACATSPRPPSRGPPTPSPRARSP